MEVELIKSFLDNNNIIGLVGATINKEKWGYKIFKDLKDAGFKVYPVNPNYSKVENNKCFADLSSLVEYLSKKPDYIITITPPKITEKTVEECKKLGIKKIWMQPGSESEKSINFCNENNIVVVHGVCIVVDALKKF
jgi:predicted CoA-binding protein